MTSGKSNHFHLKYMANQRYLQHISNLTFNLGVPLGQIQAAGVLVDKKDLALFKKNANYQKVEVQSEGTAMKLGISKAAVAQGIIEFACSAPIKYLVIEIQLSKHLISGITDAIRVPQDCKFEASTDIVIKMV